MMQRTVERLQLANVTVGLSKETVLLTGSVKNWHEKQYAQEAIRGFSSTRTIRNEIQVRIT
jgi:osmotically-inducible protein OsmY